MIPCIHLLETDFSPSLPFRPGQDRVPPEPREPGDLPEGLRSHRALLWRGGGRCQSGSAGGREPAAVPFPSAGGPNGGLPALIIPPNTRLGSVRRVQVLSVPVSVLQAVSLVPSAQPHKQINLDRLRASALLADELYHCFPLIRDFEELGFI